MSSLSSVNHSSNGWANAMPPKPAGGGKATERLFSEFDTDSSGSVDSTELQSLLSDVSQKTGLSISSSTAADLLSASDSNGDGSLSANELDSALKSVLPRPRRTWDLVRPRGGAATNGRASAPSPPPPPARPTTSCSASSTPTA